LGLGEEGLLSVNPPRTGARCACIARAASLTWRRELCFLLTPPALHVTLRLLSGGLSTSSTEYEGGTTEWGDLECMCDTNGMSECPSTCFRLPLRAITHFDA
jgi:hypothetical protein